MRPASFDSATGLAFAIGVSLFSALPFAAASATVITGTYTGTINSGSDSLNNFGGGSLAGDTITLSYAYDTGQGSYTNQNTNSPPDDYLNYFNSNGGLSITVAITNGGTTYSNTVTSASGNSNQVLDEYFNNNGILIHRTAFEVGSGATTGLNFVALNLYSDTPYVAGTILTAPITGIDNTLESGQSIELCQGSAPFSQQCEFVNANLSAGGAQSAPEPGALALFCAGLAGLGWTRRRVRRRTCV
jgi:hypothetical protein